MIIIGEKLNSSIPSAQKAYENCDTSYIVDMAKKQLDCGAHYIDVNAGVFPDEADKLVWAINNILTEIDANIVIDSTNPKSIKHVLENIKLKNTIINSITLEDIRLDGIIPLVKEYKTGIIALPIDKDGIPTTAQKRIDNSEKLIKILRENDVKDEDIYIDILVEAASAGWDAPQKALESAKVLRKKYPDIHLISGLSNVSYGLPKRKYLNSAFLSAAITSGVDSTIMDITNSDLKMILFASLLINGQDEYCMEYLTQYREIFN